MKRYDTIEKITKALADKGYNAVIEEDCEHGIKTISIGVNIIDIVFPTENLCLSGGYINGRNLYLVTNRKWRSFNAAESFTQMVNLLE